MYDLSRELCFTVMVIVGQKEKDAVEKILPECMPELQMIYKQTEERNGQRWLMADLEDDDSLYHDLFRLIRIRSPPEIPSGAILSHHTE